MKRLILPILFIILAAPVFAQYIFVDSDYDPVVMINDFFGNDSVIVSNIQFSGDPFSMGFFDTDGAGVDVHTGLVFSTGFVDDIPQANSEAGTSANLGGPNDQDIEIISGGLPSFDACVVEFDFMVTDTQLTDFRYVFASEEYPEFVGTGFNDAFGFFLTGPMYYGGPYTGGAENIALVPDTDVPVSINTVNQNINSEYYTDHVGNQFIYFDGILDALPAEFYAIPNEVYHIKIVVADVSDGIFDSAVFLGYNSLNNPDSLVPPTNFALSVQGYTTSIINESKYASVYDWDFGNGVTSNKRFPDPVTYEQEGTYDITLITQNFCCSDTLVQSVNIENTLFVNADVTKNVSCAGGNDGGISFGISGGEEPYLITWVPEIINLDSVKAGLYTYFVSDALDSLVSGELVVTEPEMLISEVIAFPETDNELGSLSVTPLGGTEPYAILWSNGSTSMEIFDLEAGNYGLTVTDANGCVVNEELEVPLMISLSYEVNTLNNPVECFGDETAIIDLVGKGGVPPYDITWESSFDPNGVGAGVYYFTIVDAVGAVLSDSVVIVEPEPITVSFDIIEATEQEGGSITVNPNGGTAPYSYLWSTEETTKTISNLSPGTYLLTISDSNGCTFEFSANMTLQEALVVQEDVINNPLLCFGDMNALISLEISGGSAPYSILWEPEVDPNGVGAGSYNYTVTDNSGVVFSNTIVITQPEELIVSIDHTDTQVGELFGSASAQVVGGVEPYSYLWNNNQTSPNLEFLPEGVYTVEVTDANGCVSSKSVVINGIVSSNEISDKFEIYPNPVNSILFIRENALVSSRIEVYDIQGHLMNLQQKVLSDDSVQVNVEDLERGIYFVQLIHEGGQTVTRKFVKI